MKAAVTINIQNRLQNKNIMRHKKRNLIIIKGFTTKNT